MPDLPDNQVFNTEIKTRVCCWRPGQLPSIRKVRLDFHHLAWMMVLISHLTVSNYHGAGLHRRCTATAVLGPSLPMRDQLTSHRPQECLHVFSNSHSGEAHRFSGVHLTSAGSACMPNPVTALLIIIPGSKGAYCVHRSPLVSFAYERGWRSSFTWAGFPGEQKEFDMAMTYLQNAYGEVRHTSAASVPL